MKKAGCIAAISFNFFVTENSRDCPTSLDLLTLIDNPVSVYEYIIIGSGPSGGNLAYHLNKAGAKCLLLEAGKFFRKETFPRNEADTAAQLYWG